MSLPLEDKSYKVCKHVRHLLSSSDTKYFHNLKRRQIDKNKQKKEAKKKIAI